MLNNTGKFHCHYHSAILISCSTTASKTLIIKKGVAPGRWKEVAGVEMEQPAYVNLPSNYIQILPPEMVKKIPKN